MKRNIFIILAFLLLPLLLQGQTVAGHLNGLGWTYQGLTCTYTPPPLDFVNLNSYFALHNTTPLDIPTPVAASDEATHPDVWDFGSEWNGYRYWLAFTPLPIVDLNENENPCIVASNDKITWVVPDGGSNPITPQPVTSYNSDTELYFENDSLYCFYRSFTTVPVGRQIVAYKSSSDGITWSVEQETQLGGLDYPLVTSSIISPSFIKFGDTFRLYAIDASAAAPDQFPYYLESPTLTGNYINKTRVHLDSSYTFLDQMWPTKEWSIWHFNINEYNGKLFMLAYLRGLNFSVDESKEMLMLADSEDGDTFKFAKTPLFQNNYTTSDAIAVETVIDAWDGKYYRSAMLPKDVDGELGWDIWYSGTNIIRDVHPFRIGYSEILPVKTHINYVEGTQNTISSSRQAEIDSANALLGDYLFCDDFQRVESGLTTSSSGYTYSEGSLAGFEVNNSLKISVASFAYIDFGVTDYEISVDAKMNDLLYTNNRFGNGLFMYQKILSGAQYVRCESGRFFTMKNSTLTDIQNDYTIQPFIQDDINNFKWQVVGDHVKYFINNKLVVEFDVTATNISEANKDAIMAATRMFFYMQNTSTEMFNITAKSL